MPTIQKPPWPAITYLFSWLPFPLHPFRASTRSSSACQSNTYDGLESVPQYPPRGPHRPSIPPCLGYSLADVLSVAKIHPFYSDSKYPPDEDAIRAAREHAASLTDADLTTQPLLKKRDLYKVIERLVNDASPQNTYRHNVYTSVTGGGSTTSKPLFFATDALENRRQRAYFGQMLRELGLIKPGDWVLTTHFTGDLYRSLDLTCETMENAGASVLAVGNHTAPSKVVQLLQDFSVNVLTGDGSQVVSVVHHISTMPSVERDKIKLEKVIYTSEGLTAAQRSHICAVLGPVRICSVLGSAEAGPYGASSSDLIPNHTNSNHADFIIDTRMTLIEILPRSFTDLDATPDTLPEGETGVIVQTSLTRLRNPVVRYLTGDIGSLHPLPEEARSLIPEAHRPYMRVLRLQGRDHRFSFSWDGFDIEFENLSAVMTEPGLGVLQWQVILDKMEPSKETSLELRVLSSRRDLDEGTVVDRLKPFFCVYEHTKHKFHVTLVKDGSEFELSQTGRKVVKFVDRCN